MSAPFCFSRKTLFNGLLVCLIFLFTIPASYSQTKKESGPGFFRGYIITNSGDSISGLINMPSRKSRTSWVRFKPRMNESERSYDPYELSSFGSIDGSLIYKSIEIQIYDKTELSFVRQIVEGPYDVFAYRFLNYDHVLIRGSSGRIFDVTNPPDTSVAKGKVTISRDKFNRYLGYVFAGDPEISVAIGSMKPTRNSIVKSVTRYYDQRGLPYQVFGIKQASFVFGFTAGAAVDKADILVADQEVTSSPAIAPYAGIQLGVSDRKSGLGVMAEASAAYRSLHYYFGTELPAATFYMEGFRKELLINTRLGITYKFHLDLPVKPVLEAGGVISASLSSDDENYMDLYVRNEDIVYSTMDRAPVMSDYFYGGFLCAGFILKVLNNNSVKITGGYERLSDFDGEKISSVRFGAVYLFKYRQ
jgi:hypothetical protein